MADIVAVLAVIADALYRAADMAGNIVGIEHLGDTVLPQIDRLVIALLNFLP